MDANFTNQQQQRQSSSEAKIDHDDDDDNNDGDRDDDDEESYCYTNVRQDISKNNIQIVDGVAFETVPSIMEVEAIIHVVKERVKNSNHGHDNKNENIFDYNDDDMAIWISLACKDDIHLNDGTPLTKVLDTIETLDDDGFIHGIGVNCFNIKHAKSLTKQIAKHQIKSKHNRTIIFYPNSGEEWDAMNEAWLIGSGCSDPESFAIDMMKSIRAIHSIFLEQQEEAKSNSSSSSSPKHCRIIVGGCCRTSPEMIRSLRNHVDLYTYKKERIK
mmetsp:Transcript_22339/g.25882  ORF Transcript_22339/g.25882 Transcript_22339/m.25882 type:complete len:272 (+) Transcript_22339:984-1799(+)